MRAGEIVGIAGIDGNGQTEMIDALAGLRSIDAGTVRIDGDDVTRDSVHGHFEDGLGHIPEDRQRRGLVLEYSIAENIALHDYRSEPASRFGWLFPRRLIERARSLIKAFDVRGGSPSTRAGALSGGNQQKVVLAREIERDPKVLIAAQPTRGLDVGAIEFVHRRRQHACCPTSTARSCSPALPPASRAIAQSAPFAMGKFALRGLAQSMARELSPQGIHVAHFVIDGGIRSAARTEPADRPDSMLDPDAIALSYWNVLQQPRSAWTWEVELRPWVEKF